MAIQDIILRSTTFAPLTNKGSELTYTELDNNFIEIYDYLATLNTGTNLNPWSISTTYTGTQYVSYAGNIYKLLTASSLGEVPTSYPSVWQLTSIGELAHEKNKDTYLDFGGTYEVPAEDLHSLVNEQVIITNVIDFETDASNGDLIPNRLYRLTSTYPYYFVRSLTVNTYSNIGWVVEKCPNVGTVTKWYQGGAYTIGDAVTYFNNVYLRLTNGTTPSTPDTDTTNWQYTPSATYYQDEVFSDAKLLVSGGTVTLYTCRDKYNNVYSGSDMSLKRWAYMDGAMNNNQVNDDGNLLDHLTLLIGNVRHNHFRNGSVFLNPKGGYAGIVMDCDFNNSLVASDKPIEGLLNKMTLVNTKLTFLNGLSITSTIDSLVSTFPLQTEFNVPNVFSPISGGLVTPNGSTVAEYVDISSTPLTLDLDTATNQHDLCGVFYLYSTNATETIDSLSRYQTAFPIKLVPTGGLTLDINLTAWASTTGNGQIVGDIAGTLSLAGDVDYVLLESVNLNGYYLWRVKQYTQTL
jgi:hypothetical protein